MRLRGIDTCAQDVEKISEVLEDVLSQFSADTPDLQKILGDLRQLVQIVPKLPQDCGAGSEDRLRDTFAMHLSAKGYSGDCVSDLVSVA